MTRVPVDEPGWDSEAFVVDGRYIERSPRRPEVRPRLEQECRVMPAIAPLLPLLVPVPEEVPADEAGPWRVRHRLVPGVSADPDELTREDGVRVGAFLRCLHDLPLGSLGLQLAPDPELQPLLDRMEVDVLPLLAGDERPRGLALLHRVGRFPHSVLAHRDLGPSHLLVDQRAVSGVIDWSDSALADPAIDLAWLLHGTPSRFREGVVAAYTPTPEEVRRSADWHRLGPWHEVLWGLEDGGPAYVASGLEGVRERLAR